MKCFESFFKHTWRLQQVHPLHQMDRSSTTKTTEMQHPGETELGEIKVMPPTNNVATLTRTSDILCKNGACKVWRSRDNESRTESPWHSLKTIFLIFVMVAFLLWIIVYTLLNRYQIL